MRSFFLFLDFVVIGNWSFCPGLRQRGVCDITSVYTRHKNQTSATGLSCFTYDRKVSVTVVRAADKDIRCVGTVHIMLEARSENSHYRCRIIPRSRRVSQTQWDFVLHPHTTTSIHLHSPSFCFALSLCFLSSSLLFVLGSLSSLLSSFMSSPPRGGSSGVFSCFCDFNGAQQSASAAFSCDLQRRSGAAGSDEEEEEEKKKSFLRGSQGR